MLSLTKQYSGIVGVVLVIGVGFGLFWWFQQGGFSPTTSSEASDVLVFRGSLAHHWNGSINDQCDFEFRLYDAQLNGVLLGDPLQVTQVAVQDGLVQIPLAPDAFTTVSDIDQERWLAVAVRCPDGDGDFAALAPRMQHQTTPPNDPQVEAAAALAAAGWEMPETGYLVCHVPTADDGDPSEIPTLNGVEYNFQGGFWLEPATELASTTD
ncbi:MAG: hypothetical protein AAGF95_13065 [Chloroflexota bacterium]